MAKREKAKAEARKAARQGSFAAAKLRNLRMSARKVRVIADVIRGMPVEQALTTLHFQPRAAAQPLLKLVDSAVANAVERGLDVDKLVVSEVLVHKGPIMRRYMPRAHGRATRIRKQTSHIEMQVAEL